VHFEVFSAAKLPGALGRSFRYLEAAADGPFVRRGAVVAPIDGDHDGELTPEELRDFFRNPDDILRREALRHLAIRHVHEWGDILGESSFVEARELGRLPAEDRRTLYRATTAPYVFLTRAVAEHAGLPSTEAVYSYHPLTFLVTLAARAGGVDMRWPPRAPLSDSDLEPRPADGRVVDAWTREPQPEQSVTAFFGPAVDTTAITRRRGDIPLIVLPPTSD
jgi:hypothetical protein